jgi:RNA polymerase sigma factor (sigma-70 family)
MDSAQTIPLTVDHLFRHEAGKLVSVLTKVFGAHNFELVEDVVQDTLVKALELWKIRGVPQNPTGWLFKVARNQALDIIRRDRRKKTFDPEVAYLLQSEYTLSQTLDELLSTKDIDDDLLRMMFICCHPALSSESQVAMILRSLCGFSVGEIARAFLTQPDNIEKRLYRARLAFREQKISFEIPPRHLLAERLENVLLSIYLLFNEGYNSTRHEDLIRSDLIEEAIRLTRLLSQNALTSTPPVWALLGLMYLIEARSHSRQDDQGHILLLPAQDRNRWDKELIQKGMECLGRSAEGIELSSYHLEAAIACEHCTAPTYSETNWPNILRYYDLLYAMKPTRIIALNRAIVIGRVHGPLRAIRSIEEIPDIHLLANYYLLPATLGELYAQLNEREIASRYLDQAIALTESASEKTLLEGKLKRLNSEALYIPD